MGGGRNLKLTGLTPREGSFLKMDLTISCTLGMRVMPPTRRT